MKKFVLIPVFFVLLFTSCETAYYSMDDYTNVEKIDAHFHIYTKESTAFEQAAKDNFRLFVINTFSADCERVHSTNDFLMNQKKIYPDHFEFSTTFCLDEWDSANFVGNTISWIDECIADGAISIKVWKNIGMEFRDKNGEIVMIDNPRFDPILKHLSDINMPLVAHLAEPRDCWMPLEKMVTNNNRNYFAEHPQYHMYLHPELPSYEEQMAARERMLEKHPDLVFIGCHLASLEWSVDEIARFFDRFPNAAVDMSARMGNLFYQTVQDRERVRNFFIKYQDRILYGTDITERDNVSPEDLYNKMHGDWMRDWEYLVTDNKMTSRLIEGEFQGLKLPRDVVDKIYSGNAKNWYKGFE